MFRRLTACLVFLGLGFASCGGLSSDTDASAAELTIGAARNWTTSPAIVEVNGASEIWAVSDIHADYKALTKLLAGANVISKVPNAPLQVQWNQSSAVLVVAGDLIDKGPDAPDVVRLLMALQASASAAGGRVVVLMGNHEAEFLADPENSHATKTGSEEGFDPELAAVGMTPAQTAAGRDDLGAFLRSLPFAARIGNWFFAHAGNTGGATLGALESALVTGVDRGGFGAAVLSSDSSILEARLSSSGPQWWDATGHPKTLLSQWTAALGVQHLVMGHQPGKVAFADGTNRARDQMFAYSGLLFLIDTGMSSGVDNTGGALLHIKNAGSKGESWEEVFPDGKKQSLASE